MAKRELGAPVVDRTAIDRFRAPHGNGSDRNFEEEAHR
jgi:hypothetical protein